MTDDAPIRLEIDGVSVAFDGRSVLTDVRLKVAPGEIVALLGPSGSGKSTLLRVVAGLTLPDTGVVRIDGIDITAAPTHRRDVGLVFQDEQLFTNMDVEANVAFGLRMHRVAPATRHTRVVELLALVGLDEFGSRAVSTLSGGEAKRVAVARSLAPRPRVLLLDEPLTGLDRDLHDRLAADLARIMRAEHTTAVLVTHDPDEAAAIADRVVSLHQL